MCGLRWHVLRLWLSTYELATALERNSCRNNYCETRRFTHSFDVLDSCRNFFCVLDGHESLPPFETFAGLGESVVYSGSYEYCCEAVVRGPV